MDDINAKILKALQLDAAAKQLPEGEINPLTLVTRGFRGGSFKITGIFVFFMAITFAALAIYCAYQMFGTFDLDSKIHWLAGLLCSGIAFAVVRLWFFMELNRLSILRDIKRVELQIAALTGQMAE